ARIDQVTTIPSDGSASFSKVKRRRAKGFGFRAWHNRFWLSRRLMVAGIVPKRNISATSRPLSLA
ncbi:MAG: hypothetical protein ABIO35_02270, partial [Nitrobacter sp.]